MKEKQKDRTALALSLVIHAGLLVLFIFFGLSYMEPKPEDGIAIQFGYTPEGRGLQATSTEVNPEIAPPQPTEATPSNEPEIATQDVVDAPTVTTKTKSNTQTQKPKEEEKPQVDQRLTGALSTVKGNENSGQGDGEKDGFQGDPSGQPGGAGTGTGGGGGTGNYLLGNRQARSKPLPSNDCTDAGRVVVKVFVDRQGTVTKALPGEAIPNGAGTTTTSTCLLDRAKSAALRTTWAPDPNAPELQVGFIIYVFKQN